jgi:hypothetical protein
MTAVARYFGLGGSGIFAELAAELVTLRYYTKTRDVCALVSSRFHK